MNGTELLQQFQEWYRLARTLLEPYSLDIATGLGVMVLLLLFLSYNARRKTKKMRASLERTDHLLQQIQPTRGLEKNLSYLLEMVGSVMFAPTYAFYIYEPKNNNYVLKAVRHQSVDFGNVRPSYSGLVPYKKESYAPLISYSVDSLPDRSGIVLEGEVPLFVIPIQGLGMIRLGPVTKEKKQATRTLDELSAKMKMILPSLIETESMKNQVDITVHSVQALKNISDTAMEHKATMDLMLRASYKSINASGGMVLERTVNGFCVPAYIGLEPEETEQILNDQELHQALFDLVKEKTYDVLNRNDTAFSRIPDYFLKSQAEMFAVVKLESRVKGNDSLLLYWFDSRRYEKDLLSHEMSKLDTIVQEMEVVFHSQALVNHHSHSYTNLMKNLARMMDNLNPYTVGYSEQMSRYAIIIAREMKLPEEEIRDIALAAHLSNIGTLGLSMDLYQKEGKYTEMEFELMKLHTEVGASIISVMTGNKNVASYVLHHHERIDGNGYPAGLRGDEIPSGARIIAVIQTFLAKINGRKNRDPIQFDLALQTLRAAAGTQLDGRVVDALLNWFRKKQMNPALAERSLGSCWEMCCTPSSICEHCPVYRRTDVNCWQVEGNNCKAHGKSCDTCFVHTELLTRTGTRA
jgi:HD-GYP domain-containing protein (c-di-GMP phosphodiesterase class II)